MEMENSGRKEKTRKIRKTKEKCLKSTKYTNKSATNMKSEFNIAHKMKVTQKGKEIVFRSWSISVYTSKYYCLLQENAVLPDVREIGEPAKVARHDVESDKESTEQ